MLVKNQRGQSLIEYVILVALIGVATMGMVRVLQHTVSVNMGGVIDALQAHHGPRRRFEAVNAHDLRKADFSNFMSNTRGQGKDADQE